MQNRSMTSPDQQYADRVYRSTAGMAGGALLLILAGWLGGDALISGDGHTPWISLAALLCVVPLTVAFTLRPAVFANDARMRVRNPFRTITLPWASVEGIRGSFSNEVYADGKKYQLWAIPVSLRGRKKAARQQSRLAVEMRDGRSGGSPVGHRPTPSPSDGAVRAQGDQAVHELRELAELNAGREQAQGAPVVHWAYEVIAPVTAGAVLLTVLLAIG